MTGAGPGHDGGERWIVRHQRPGARVEPVDKQTVDAEVGHQDEPVGGIDNDGVGVGVSLALGIDAVAGVLHERGARADAAVGLQDEGGEVAARVVGHEDVVAGLVQADVTGVFAAGGHLVQQIEVAGFRVDRVPTDPARGTRIAGVKMPAVGMDDEERRLLGFEEEFGLGERACVRVKPREGKAKAGARAVGAEVDKHVATSQRGNGPDEQHEKGKADKKRRTHDSFIMAQCDGTHKRFRGSPLCGQLTCVEIRAWNCRTAAAHPGLSDLQTKVALCSRNDAFSEVGLSKRGDGLSLALCRPVGEAMFLFS